MPVNTGELSTGDCPRLRSERDFLSRVPFLCAKPGAFACFQPAFGEGANEEASGRLVEVLCNGSAVDCDQIVGAGILVEGHGRGGIGYMEHPGQLDFVCWAHRVCLQPSPL